LHQRAEQDTSHSGLQTEVVGREVFNAVDFVHQFTSGFTTWPWPFFFSMSTTWPANFGLSPNQPLAVQQLQRFEHRSAKLRSWTAGDGFSMHPGSPTRGWRS